MGRERREIGTKEEVATAESEIGGDSLRPQRTRIDALRAYVRNSPWVVISVAAHLAVIAILGMSYVRSERPKEVVIPVIPVHSQRDEIPEAPPVEPPVERHKIPNDDELEVVDFQNEHIVAPVSIDSGDPNPSVEPALVSNGAFTRSNTGIGVGDHGYRDGSGPTPFTSRNPGNHRPGKGRGPTVQTEEAVLNGQLWLCRHQNADGSWTMRGSADHCVGDGGCFTAEDNKSDQYDEGLTGLALLSFLGAGYSHQSKRFVVDPVTKQTFRFGEVVKRGLMYLMNHQQEDGSFSTAGPFMYNDAIATLAMCEAYALTKSAYWKKPARRAIEFLASAQRPGPTDSNPRFGWRYTSRKHVEDHRADYASESAFRAELTDADASVTGWVAMAFKSAQLAGLEVPKEACDGALAFAKWVGKPNGLAGYQRPDQAGQKLSGPNDQYQYFSGSMAAVTACIRIFMEHDPTDPFLVAAADQLVKPESLPSVSDDGLSIDYYYWYYATLALNQIDGPDSPKHTGKFWGPWNTAMTKSLLALQEKSDNTCRKGAWMARDRWSHDAGRIYSTAINVLTLEVYYRYENAFGMKQ